MSPIIVISALDYNATGSGIFHIPTVLNKFGPIVGVIMVDELVISKLAGTGILLVFKSIRFPLFWEYPPYPGKFKPHFEGTVEDDMVSWAAEVVVPVSVKQATPFIVLYK